LRCHKLTVYTDEKSFLKDFFLSVFKDANDPRCQPFFDLMLQNSKYVNPTYPGKDKGSRMQVRLIREQKASQSIQCRS
jgi:hypothetical protein